MSLNSIYERIGSNEQAIEDLERRMDKAELKSESQTKTNILLEMQTQVNKDQNEQMRQIGETLQKVNDNLTGLNTGMHDLNKRVTLIENNQDSKKIDLGALGKDIVFKVIPTVIATILGAYLLFQLNL